MAAPSVTGALALLLQKEPAVDWGEARRPADHVYAPGSSSSSAMRALSAAREKNKPLFCYHLRCRAEARNGWRHGNESRTGRAANILAVVMLGGV
jgi:hypothetical protein